MTPIRNQQPDQHVMSLRSVRRLVLGLAVLAVTGGQAFAFGGNHEKPVLRVCADPDNLPFTGNATSEPGIYMELADHLAGQLGRTLVPVWAPTYMPEKMMHMTLLSHRCDMFPGVPSDAKFMEDEVILSRPLLDVGYVLVTPPGVDMSGPHAMSGKRIAVQFGTPGQDMLARRDDVVSVTVMNAEEGFAALKQGRADAALLWGPSAGYLNRTVMGGIYPMKPISGRRMQWKVAIAFAPNEGRLRDQVDNALAEDGPFVKTIQARYGFSQDIPWSDSASVISVSDNTEIEAFHVPVITKDTTPSLDVPPVTQPAAAAAVTKTAEAGAPSIPEGHTVFNGTCAHCHGPDAVQGESRINLRLLQQRYAGNMDKVFFETVAHGRPDKGMPAWTGVFTDDQFKSILAFLHSVQEKG